MCARKELALVLPIYWRPHRHASCVTPARIVKFSRFVSGGLTLLRCFMPTRGPGRLLKPVSQHNWSPAEAGEPHKSHNEHASKPGMAASVVTLQAGHLACTRVPMPHKSQNDFNTQPLAATNSISKRGINVHVVSRSPNCGYLLLIYFHGPHLCMSQPAAKFAMWRCPPIN